MEEFKPGQVVAPNDSQPLAPLPAAPNISSEPVSASTAPEATQPVMPAPASFTPPPTPVFEATPEPTETGAPQATFSYQSEEAGGVPTGLAPQNPAAPSEVPDEISWTASEFILHEKSPAWYGMAALAGAVGAALVYWLTKDKITTFIILLAAISLAVFAARKPKVQTYTINGTGLHVGPHVYQFENFKSFSINEEDSIATIVLMPLKRFMPMLTVYVAPDVEDGVVSLLSYILPFEQHRQDAVDSLLKRIRF